ncbi:MAG: phage portal protein [Actinobacteria bacterium]|nr:phage portal protein [Actinomycetota bacterium]
MGWLDRWRFVSAVAEQASAVDVPAGRFVVDQASIGPELFGLPDWRALGTSAVVPRIRREAAMQVPAVKRARDLICGTIGALPAYILTPSNERRTRALFDQPEQDVPRSVTMTRTVEDMLFEGYAWWRVLELGWDGYPVRVRRLDATTVDVRGDQRVYVRPDGSVQGNAWEHVPDAQLIRFDAPSDPLLVAGARAIRTYLTLDAAASRYADAPGMIGWFTSREGADPGDTDEVQKMLDDWQAARIARVTGYVPDSLEYHQATVMAPKDMQLAEARDYAVLEIARLTGIDPEDLGVSTTSRTYANAVDRRMSLQDFTLGPFVTAIQDRLSMGDVTPRGTRVRLDFGGFTRSSEADRMATYKAATELGVYDLAEVQRREEQPQRAKPKPAAPPAPPAQPQEQPVDQSAQQSVPASVTFARETGLTFEAPAGAAFAVDGGQRTVTGLVVPYGAASSVKGGRRFRFAKGSLKYSDVGRVKLLRDHDHTKALGVAVKATETPAGMVATFRIARGPDGDAALALAEDGVLDGFSVGVDFQDDGLVLADDGVVDVSSAAWREASLTAVPSFDDARVSGVALTAERPDMECTSCGQVHAAGTPCAPSQTFTAPNTSTVQVQPAPGLGETIATALREGFAALAPTGREVIPAGRVPGGTLTVVEQPLYRFDGGRGQQCFSSDLINGLGKGDGEAAGRIQTFMDEQFAVTVANAATLNPNRQRPDMYVDQAEFLYPIWDTINKGTLSDNTPFVLPKFGTSSGLVGDHTEGIEPTGTGALTTTSQTITPTPLSGKTIINREVWDQGGNPQLDTILWRQIMRAYYEGLESYAAAQIAAIAGTITDINLGIAVVDAALEAAITSALASLQYIRGGNRMRDFFVQVDLYKALAAAKDSNGRKLFPIIAPQNATGESTAFYEAINVGGLKARPAWALAASGSVAASSWLFDREVMCGWASAPQKLTMDAIKVATVEIGVWGYKAFACTDVTFAREVIYDPV